MWSLEVIIALNQTEAEKAERKKELDNGLKQKDKTKVA